MAERPVGKRRSSGEAGIPTPAVSDEITADGTTAFAEIDNDSTETHSAASSAQEGSATTEIDDDSDYDGGSHNALPPRVDSWRKRSATGAILTGFALGLQQVFEPERKEPAIVLQTSGDPPTDLPVEAELEMATTRRSVVRIRPWLLDDDVEGLDGDARSLDETGSGAAGSPLAIAPRARRPRRLRSRKR